MPRMTHDPDALDRDDAPPAGPTGFDAEDSTDFVVDEDFDETDDADEADDADEPAEAADPHADDYTGGPDDALGLYLRQMGSIRLLSRDEEVAIASRLERTRSRFRRASLYCAHVVARGCFTFERVLAGNAPVDPTIDVYSTPELRLSRDQILHRMPADVPLCRKLLREEMEAFNAGLRLSDPAAKSHWRRTRFRRLVKLNRLMSELSPRTELLERWVDELTDMADEMSHLVRSHREAATADDRHRRGVAVRDAQEKVHLTHDELAGLCGCSGGGGRRTRRPAANWPRPTCGWW
jgi:RNA polymerase primary sigma factor